MHHIITAVACICFYKFSYFVVVPHRRLLRKRKTKSNLSEAISIRLFVPSVPSLDWPKWQPNGMPYTLSCSDEFIYFIFLLLLALVKRWLQNFFEPNIIENYGEKKKNAEETNVIRKLNENCIEPELCLAVNGKSGAATNFVFSVSREFTENEM